MSRPTLILLATIAAASSQAQQVAPGAASRTPATVTGNPAGTTERAGAAVGEVLKESGQIVKDAVSVETVENQGGGVVSKRKETLPEAAGTRLSGLLRTRETLPGGADVTREHNLTTVKEAASKLTEPPFTHTRQQGRTTVSEKSYLPIGLPSGALDQTQTLPGGATSTTSVAGRVENLRKFYYTHKKLPGGGESYGPPDLLPDSNTLAPLTTVTERLPNGTTVTRDRALVSAIKNPSRIGFTTTSTERGVTTQKFHSLVPDAPLSVDWAKVRGAMGGEEAKTQPDKNPDGSMVAVAPSYKQAFNSAEQTAFNNPAAKQAQATTSSVWSKLNPLGWGRSIANTTKGYLSQGAAAVPKGASTGSTSFQNSLRANKNNVMRPGGG